MGHSSLRTRRARGGDYSSSRWIWAPSGSPLPKSQDKRATIIGKFEQYDRYLVSGRFAKTYSPYGEFRSFILLFVTYGQSRIENVRMEASVLSQKLHGYYRLAT